MNFLKSSQALGSDPFKDNRQQNSLLAKDLLVDPLNQLQSANINHLSRASAPAVVSDSNNSLSTAKDLGLLNSTRPINDSVGSIDPADYYRFTLAANSNLNLSLTGISTTSPNNVDVKLIRDLNNNSAVDNGEIIATLNRGVGLEESLNRSGLAAGTYYVQVNRAAGDSNYKLSLSNSKPSNLLLNEFDFGALGNNPAHRYGTVDNNSTADLYQFTLGNNSNFNLSLNNVNSTSPNNADARLIRDYNNNGVIDTGEVIATSTRGVGLEESINRSGLAAGKYFVQVYQVAGSTSYNLRLSNSKPSNLLLNEVNFGALGNNPTHRYGTVDNNNTAELYQFTLGDNSNFNLSLNNVNSTSPNNADARLIRDFNNNGVVDADEVIATSTRGVGLEESINRSGLAAGKYFVQVYQVAGSTSYNLRLSSNKISNLLLNEADMGTLGSNPTSRNGRIDNNNTADLYQFTIGENNTFNLSLTTVSQSSPNNLDVRLIHDVNNNGVVDTGEVLVSSTRGVGGEESINNYGFLSAGKYFVQVYQAAGASNYTLRLSNNNPSNLLLNENDLGSLSSSPINRTGRIDPFSNHSDLYQFTLAQNSNFNLAFSFDEQEAFLSPEARLIRDANNNGIVDAGEVIAIASFPVSRYGDVVGDGVINRSSLEAGRYFVQVHGRDVLNSSNYSLRLSSSSPSNVLFREFYTYAGDLPQSNSIDKNNTSDLYQFNVGANSNLNIALTDISQTSPNNLDLRLIRDENNNGFVDAGEVVDTSTRGVGFEESINRSGLAEGLYYVQVYQVSGSSNYTLRLSNNTPSNLLVNDNNLGTLSNTPITHTSSFDPWNTSEFHQFTLATTSDFHLYYTDDAYAVQLTPDVRLIADRNSNRMVDDGEVITYLNRPFDRYGGVASEGTIDVTNLSAGKYYVQVAGGYEYAAGNDYILKAYTGNLIAALNQA